ncbi:MAG: hypothetical protein JXA90_01470, partial [Planctomycetes bacterium]|nr:hypothetical protein [Planctomycetota bacterium]
TSLLGCALLVACSLAWPSARAQDGGSEEILSVVSRQVGVQVGAYVEPSPRRVDSRVCSVFVGDAVFPRAESRAVSVLNFDSAPPAAVEGLSITPSADGTSVTLDWSGYPELEQKDLKEYRIYISPHPFFDVSPESLAADPDIQLVATVPAGSFSHVVEGLEAFEEYYFAVVPVDHGGFFVAAITYGGSYPLFPRLESSLYSVNVGNRAEPELVRIESRAVSVLNATVDLLPPITGLLVRCSETGETVWLDWTAYSEDENAGVVGYRIFVFDRPFTSIDGQSFLMTIDLPAGVQAHEITGLDPLQEYYFAVVPLNIFGEFDPQVAYGGSYPLFPRLSSRVYAVQNGSFTDPEPIRIESRAASLLNRDMTPPAPVTELTASWGSGVGEVDLDWTAYDETDRGGILEYRIYVALGHFEFILGWAPFAVVAGGTKRYTVPGLQERPYYFAVVPVDYAGNYHPAVTAVTQYPEHLLPAEELVGLQIECFRTGLRFLWGPSPDRYGDLVGYRVYFDGAAVPVELTRNQLLFEVMGLSPATAYPIRITTIDDDGNESRGVDSVGVTLLPNPTALDIRPRENGDVEIYWDPPAGGGKSKSDDLVARYAVYASTENFSSIADLEGAESRPVAFSTDTFALVRGLAGGRLYHFAVTAINISGGEEAEVQTASAVTEASPEGPQIAQIYFNFQPFLDGMSTGRSGYVTVAGEAALGVYAILYVVDGVPRFCDHGDFWDSRFLLDVSSLSMGPHELRIEVVDQRGNAASEERAFSVTALGAGEPPEADAGGPYSLAYYTALVILDASDSYDPNGDPPDAGALTFQWDIGDDGIITPPEEGLTGVSAPVSQAYAVSAGLAIGSPLAVSVTVRDQEGLSSKATATIEYRSMPPRAEGVTRVYGPLEAGMDVHLEGTVSDPDEGRDVGEALKVEWDVSPARSADDVGDGFAASAAATVSYFDLVSALGKNWGRIYLNAADASGLVTSVGAIILAPGVDLAPGALTPPPSLVPGSSQQISWELLNAGGAIDGHTWGEALYLSTDGTPGGGIEIASFIFSDTLAAGEAAARRESITLPAGITDEHRFLILVIDPEDEIAERDETNNTLVVPVCVGCLAPDLVATPPRAPVAATEGLVMPLSWTVRNDGKMPSPAGLAEAVYLSDDPAGGGDLLIARFFTLPALGPGESVASHRYLFMPEGLNGEYYFSVVCDDLDDVSEPGAEDNNAAVASTPTIVHSSLILGETHEFTLDRETPRKYFSLQLPPETWGRPLLVELDDPDPLDQNSLFVRSRAPVSETSFEYAADARGESSRRLVIPRASQSLFLLAKADVVSGESSSLALTATVVDLALEALSATRAGLGVQALPASITGGGFEVETEFTLEAAGAKGVIPAIEKTLVTSSRADVVLDLSGAAAGSYDLVARFGELEARLPGAFEIVESRTGPLLEVEILGADSCRRDSPSELVVRYRNAGDAPLPAPLLRLRAWRLAEDPAEPGGILPIDPGPIALRLEGDIELEQSELLFLAIHSGGVPGSLPPAAEGELHIFFRYGECAGCSLRFDVEVFSPSREDFLCWDEQPLPPGVSPEHWHETWPCLSALLGATWREYELSLGSIARSVAYRGGHPSSLRHLSKFAYREAAPFIPNRAILGELLSDFTRQPLPLWAVGALLGGDARALSSTDSRGTFSLEGLEAEAGYEILAQNLRITGCRGCVEGSTAWVPRAADVLNLELYGTWEWNDLPAECAECPSFYAPGAIVEMPEGLFARVASLELAIGAAVDPNEKEGPGMEDLAPVAAGQEMVYTVFFENEPSASAYAHVVAIEDIFEETFDVTSARLLGFGFGDHSFSFDELGDDRFRGYVSGSGSAYAAHALVELMDPEGEYPELYVDVSAGIDIAARTLRWTFTSLDPWSCEIVDGQPELSTCLLPTGVEEGFLPSNDESHRGEGFVRFSIRPRSDLPDGEIIENSAAIYFDLEPAVPTNTYRNVLRRLVPRVAPTCLVPDSTSGLSFDLDAALTWQASPGAVSYDVYLAEGAVEPDRLVAEGITSTAFRPEALLEPDTLYSWKVVARNESGAIASETATFRTVSALPEPPQAPTATYPPDGAGGVALSPVLDWQPAGGAEVYAVYLWRSAEASRPAVPIAAGLGETRFAVRTVLDLGVEYRWQIVARNSGGETEGPVLSFTTGSSFQRGDANADGGCDLSDAIFILGYLFLGSATPQCLDAADNDDSGQLDLTDAIVVLGYLFLGGPAPRDPFGGCGSDPSEDTLGCQRFPPCE